MHSNRTSEAVTMDILEAIPLPTTGTFWNSHDPALDPFDEPLVPTIASVDPLEAGMSPAFQHLFSSPGSTCDEGDDHQAMFRVNTPPQQANIFDDHHHNSSNVAGGAEESSLAILPQPLFHTNAYDAVSSESSQFTWSLPSDSPPQYNHPQAGELDAADAQGLAGDLDPDFLGPLSLNGLDQSGHGSENQVPLLKVPLISQPSFRQPSGIKECQPGAINVSLGQSWRNQFSNKDQTLGSPSGVIAVGSDHNMATSFTGPSSFHRVHDHGGITATQSISETQQQAGHGTKRKRSKAPKDSNEVETQRINHIVVERNRRRQMNEHLATLRALMPESYAQKNDQASVVGGTIAFLKDLEHLLAGLQSQKRQLTMAIPDPQHARQVQIPSSSVNSSENLQGPFQGEARGSTESQVGNVGGRVAMGVSEAVEVGEATTEAVGVEVRREGAERALVKVVAVWRSGQLLRAVVALESLALTVMHANITTVGHTVLHSFQAHVPPLCRLNAREMATAIAHRFTSLPSLPFLPIPAQVSQGIEAVPHEYYTSIS